MKSGMLFNTTDDFRVPARIVEPLIWVHRLAVLDRWGTDKKPALDIEFRRGLNIIATADPGKGEQNPVGHDVGKTLLTRLIRYCLGEAQYGRKSVREAVQREMADGYVVAEVFVAGERWTVARPLAGEPRPPSWSWQNISWKDVLTQNRGDAFARFIDAISNVTVAQCAPVVLPGRKRTVAWLDMLAWLSRDQHCAYRDPLEWRSKWAESGHSEFDVEDASLVVRLSMDLVNDEEGQIIEERKRLMKRKADTAEDVTSKRARLQRTREILVQRLAANEELFGESLFSVAARERVESKIRDLRTKIDQLPEETGLSQAIEERRAAAIELQKQEQTLTLRTEDHVRAVADLKRHRSSNSTGETGFGDLFGCPLSRHDCRNHTANQTDPNRRDYRQILIDELAGQLSRLDQQIAAAEKAKDVAAKRVEAAMAKENPLQVAVTKRIRPLQRRLAMLEAIRHELKSYDELETDCDRLDARIGKLDRRIEQLRVRQHEIAAHYSRKLKRLNDSLNYVSQFILGKGAEDVIRIGVNRLTFATDDTQSSPGEGIATSATLSLDFACLRASLAGLGFLPRFLMHDSPRGGDLEQHLYARLFELILELEDACTSPAPFQYILATTTPPPKSVAKKPYLRLTLDRRDPKQHLLGRRF